MVSRNKAVGGDRLESILHSELFIHQQNLQSFKGGRDVQAFHLEMSALHSVQHSVLHICMCARLQDRLCQSNKASRFS